ncbi:hypothetical protein [Pseudomonas aeruginosa]|uniref:hypothetical protein n=1 Tax=Pseudomonas aeruginosa TaxID=287 RepID=UPI0031E10575
MEDLNRRNFNQFLTQFMQAHDHSNDDIAKVVGCGTRTIQRLSLGSTAPTDEMLKQGAVLMVIGVDKFKKLSKADRETISEKIGSVGGGVLGFASVTGVVSSLGLAGLSAAGVTSGLAALGAIVGGGMVAGLSVAAAIPIAGAAAGYGLVKGIKHLTSKLNKSAVTSDALDPIWEQLWTVK